MPDTADTADTSASEAGRALARRRWDKRAGQRNGDEAYVRRLVAAAPPLTQATKDKLAALLTGGEA